MPGQKSKQLKLFGLGLICILTPYGLSCLSLDVSGFSLYGHLLFLLTFSPSFYDGSISEVKRRKKWLRIGSEINRKWVYKLGTHNLVSTETTGTAASGNTATAVPPLK